MTIDFFAGPLTRPETVMPSAQAILLTREQHGAMVAYMTLRYYDDALLICDVFTIPQVRGEGYASSLLEEAKAACTKAGLPAVLRAAASGAPGTLTDDEVIAWYRRHGFNAHPDWNDEESFDGTVMWWWP